MCTPAADHRRRTLSLAAGHHAVGRQAAAVLWIPRARGRGLTGQGRADVRPPHATPPGAAGHVEQLAVVERA